MGILSILVSLCYIDCKNIEWIIKMVLETHNFRWPILVGRIFLHSTQFCILDNISHFCIFFRIKTSYFKSNLTLAVYSSALLFQAEISTCSKSLLEKYQTEQDQSKLPKWPTCMRSFKSITPADDVITFDLSDVENLHELKVPTCSYRMGVPNMGYGVAVIGEFRHGIRCSSH